MVKSDDETSKRSTKDDGSSRKDKGKEREGSSDHHPPRATIRSYDHQKDFKFLRFLIGSNILSRTGRSNKIIFWSNPILKIWSISYTIFLSSNLNRIRSSHSNRIDGSSSSPPPSPMTISLGSMMFYEIVIRLPILLSLPTIILLLINHSNKRHFYRVLEDRFREEDLRDPKTYYSGSLEASSSSSSSLDNFESSKILVFDYGGRQLGFIAIDLEKRTLNENSKKEEEEEEKEDHNYTCLIRHLAVSNSFKSVGIEFELISNAIDLIFEPQTRRRRKEEEEEEEDREKEKDRILIKSIRVRVIDELDLETVKVLKSLGFKKEDLPRSKPSSSSSSFCYSSGKVEKGLNKNNNCFLGNYKSLRSRVLKLFGIFDGSSVWVEEIMSLDYEKYFSEKEKK